MNTGDGMVVDEETIDASIESEVGSVPDELLDAAVECHDNGFAAGCHVSARPFLIARTHEPEVGDAAFLEPIDRRPSLEAQATGHGGLHLPVVRSHIEAI